MRRYTRVVRSSVERAALTVKGRLRRKFAGAESYPRFCLIFQRIL